MAVLTVVQKHRLDKSSHVQEHNRSCSCFITQANLVLGTCSAIYRGSGKHV